MNGMIAEQVVDQDEEEDVDEVRHEAHEVVAADDVAGDAVADEAVGLLAGELQPARHHARRREAT